MIPLVLPVGRCRVAGLLGAIVLAMALAAPPASADQADDQFAVAAGHYAAGRWKLAIEEFQAFLAKHPDHPKANSSVFLLGEALLRVGRADEARQQFRLYLGREPQGEFARQALFREAEAAYLGGNLPAARTQLEQFLAKYPDERLNAYVLAYLGDAAAGLDDATAAAKHFRECLRRFPQGQLQDDCRLGLGRALEKLGQNEEAERLYLAVAGKTGSRLADEAQFRLGVAQYSMGRFSQAIDTFTLLETKWPASPWKPHARLARAWALWKLDRLDEAKPLLEGLATDPKVAVTAQYWLGLAEKAQGHWTAAAKTLLAAAAADPKHDLLPAMRFQAGDALLKAGDTAAAVAQFDQVLAAAANEAWLDHALRGKLQAALQQKDHAAIDRLAGEFRRRCAQSPLIGDVDRILATSLLDRKDFAAAAKLLEPLLRADDQGEQALDDRHRLAAAYEGLQRYEHALKTLAPVVQSAAGGLKAEAQLRQGSLLVALRRYGEAIGPLEAFWATNPTGDAAVKVRGELAICYARTKQLDKAKRIYHELLEKHAQHELLTATIEQLAEAAYEAQEAAWSAELFARLRGGGTGDYDLKGLSGLAWSQFKAGKLAEAAATFEQLLRRNPPPAMAAEAALARGQILERLDQADPALAMYDLVIDKQPQAPQHPEALLAAARLRDRLQQDEQAAALYERLAKDYPELPHRDAVLYEWAWVLQELGKPDQAAELFQRLRREYAQSRYAADAAYRLAQRALAAKDYTAAKQLIGEVLAGNAEAKTRQYARYLEGQLAVVQQQWEDVQRAFGALVQEFPDSPLRLVAEFWVAESLFRRNDLEAAAERFEQLSRQIQGRRDIWLAMIPLRRAQILAHQKQWNEAFALAGKIEAEYPSFEQQYEADYLLGRCLHARAQLQEAREAFEKVIKSPAGAKTETAAMAQWMIGETYFHQKNYAAAVREYLRLEILYAYPDWQAAALLQAGKCHELLGQRKEAAQVYTRLLKLYPNTRYAPEAAGRLKDSGDSSVGGDRTN